MDIGDNKIKVTQAETQLCLYLNGYTLSGSGAVMFSAGTKTPALNVIGTGNVVYSGTGNAYSFTKASVNIYDVTHTATGSGNLVLHGGDLKMYLNGTTSFNGPVKLDRETDGTEQLVLRDSATISDLYLADTAYLEIADGWTGTIGSLTAPTQVDGDGDTVIPEANVAVLGETLSGTIKFGKGIETSLKNGQLKVEDKFNPTEENSYKSYCQICEKTATWTPVSGALGTVSADAHYYLTEDVTHTTADAWFMEVASGATVHFNMNGYDVTANAEDGTNVLQHGIEVKGTLDLFNTEKAEEKESVLIADPRNSIYGSIRLNSSAAKVTLYDNVKVCAGPVTAEGKFPAAVTVVYGTFTMEGGTVYSDEKDVHGVRVDNVDAGRTAAFVMNGGTAINTTGDETIKVGSSGASGKVNIGTLKGGTISGVVRCASGSVVLDESINPGARVSVGSYGKLVVNENWTGTGAASFDPAVVISEYLVPDANGATTGDFPGTLTMFDGSGRLINDNNKLKIVIAKVGEEWYTTTADAVAVAGSDVITMAGNAEVALTDENNDYYIDAAGNDITVTGTGNLYAIDTENDDYSGYGKWTISDVTVKPVTQVTDGNRYVLILNSDDSTYSAHRLDIKIKAVNLRTSTAGLYYTAEYKCDAALAKKVASYGVGLSVYEMPTANFNGNSALTQIETTDGLADKLDVNNTIKIYSGAVTNIFTKTDDVENTDTNAENAAKEIYANAYLEIDTVDSENTYVFGNIGSETVADDAVGANGDGAVYNMGKVLEAINSMVETDQTVNALMTEFCSQWPETLDAINNAYSIDAIIALIPSSDEENA